jgi:putative membrane protein
MRYVISFVGNAIALFLTAKIVSGVSVANLTTLLIATLVLALINTFIRPIIRLFSLPITLMTFGLFSLVINMATFALAALFVKGFGIDGIIPAFLGALVFSILTTVIDFVTNKTIKPAVTNE